MWRFLLPDSQLSVVFSQVGLTFAWAPSELAASGGLLAGVPPRWFAVSPFSPVAHRFHL